MKSETTELSARAKELYDRQLRAQLEANCHGQFLAIEPDSASHFVGDTLDEAVERALDVFPERKTL